MDRRGRLQFFRQFLAEVRIAGKMLPMSEAIRSAKHQQRRQTKPRRQRIAEWQEAGPGKFALIALAVGLFKVGRIEGAIR